MPSVTYKPFMLSVIKQNVTMLSAVAPFERNALPQCSTIDIYGSTYYKTPGFKLCSDEQVVS
jgi:hypothetical protein